NSWAAVFRGLSPALTVATFITIGACASTGEQSAPRTTTTQARVMRRQWMHAGVMASPPVGCGTETALSGYPPGGVGVKMTPANEAARDVRAEGRTASRAEGPTPLAAATDLHLAPHLAPTARRPRSPTHGTLRRLYRFGHSCACPGRALL